MIDKIYKTLQTHFAQQGTLGSLIQGLFGKIQGLASRILGRDAQPSFSLEKKVEIARTLQAVESTEPAMTKFIAKQLAHLANHHDLSSFQTDLLDSFAFSIFSDEDRLSVAIDNIVNG